MATFEELEERRRALEIEKNRVDGDLEKALEEAGIAYADRLHAWLTPEIIDFIAPVHDSSYRCTDAKRMREPEKDGRVYCKRCLLQDALEGAYNWPKYLRLYTKKDTEAIVAHIEIQHPAAVRQRRRERFARGRVP